VLDRNVEPLPEDLAQRVKEREEARKAKDFKKADRIRDAFREKGFILEDTPFGTIWSRK